MSLTNVGSSPAARTKFLHFYVGFFVQFTEINIKEELNMGYTKSENNYAGSNSLLKIAS